MYDIVTSKASKVLAMIAVVAAFAHLVTGPSALTLLATLGWVVAVILHYAFELRTEQLTIAIDALEDAGFNVIIGDDEDE